MSGGRPRTAIGTYGAVYVMRRAGRCVAETRFRDLDGQLRKVTATADSASAATALLKEHLLDRGGFGSGGQLSPASPSGDLARAVAGRPRPGRRNQEELPGPGSAARAPGLRALHPWGSHHGPGGAVSQRRGGGLILEGPALAHHAQPALRVRVAARRHLPQSRRRDLASPHAQESASGTHADADRGHPRGRGHLAHGPGPTQAQPDGQVRDIVEVLLGTAMRPGEVLALRPCDVEDRTTGMVVAVTEPWCSTRAQALSARGGPSRMRRYDGSRYRSSLPRCCDADWTAFRRRGRSSRAERRAAPPIQPPAHLPEFLVGAGLADSGISLRWYRRTGATVVARGLGSDAAAALLGHTSTAITEDHYIERDRTVDLTPAAQLERTLRPLSPEGTLLGLPAAVG